MLKNCRIIIGEASAFLRGRGVFFTYLFYIYANIYICKVRDARGRNKVKNGKQEGGSGRIEAQKANRKLGDLTNMGVGGGRGVI